MKLPYIDLHTHTNISDGNLPPRELVAQAREAGIGILALTDHNSTADLSPLRADFSDMILLQGSEITCLYTDPAGKTHELHVVALGFDPAHPKMREVFRRNQPDRRPYINAILEKLAGLGIDVGTYDDLQAANPDSRHFGRMQIARQMQRRGYVSSVNDAFDLYLGAHGERRAYVPNPLQYVSLEEAVDAILSAGGVPVLAHLYYYLLTEEGCRELLRTFKALTGDSGAMEVEYGMYTRAEREELRHLAEEFGLMPSCASDYHGNMDGETLAHGFDAAVCLPILKKLEANRMERRIREFFDGRIFLSFDPADRSWIHPVMRAIHNCWNCTALEIRTDGLPRPGELFVLTVSDRLLLNDGCPMEAALAKARELGLTILPLLPLPLDPEWLEQSFPDIRNWIDPWSEELEGAMAEWLNQSGVQVKEYTPEGSYLLGMAYLRGIGVEPDRTRAICLLAAAAEDGVEEAGEALADLL